MLACPTRRDQNLCTCCTAPPPLSPRLSPENSDHSPPLLPSSALSLGRRHHTKVGVFTNKKPRLMFEDSFLSGLILRLICYEIESYRGPTPSYVWLSDHRQGRPRFNSRSMETTQHNCWTLLLLLLLLTPRQPPKPGKTIVQVCPTPFPWFNICLGLSYSLFG